MTSREHDQRVRRVFGPAVAPPPVDQEPEPPPRRRRWMIAVGAALVLVGAAGAAGYVATPHDHVAQGCFWWSAETVGSVRPGDHGCVRGYFVAGALSEAPEPAAYRLSLEVPPNVACGYKPGDAVVARYHAVFDDGRTIIVIDGC